MNRFFTGLIEKSLELGFYATRAVTSPNPFRPVESLDLSWTADCPEDFYAVPETVPDLEFCKERLDAGHIYGQFTFPSSYNSPVSKNNVVHGLADLGRVGQAKAALVIVHGHAMTNYKLLERYAQPSIRAGMDAYFLELPYHMQRKPRGSWSGQHSLNANIEESAMAFMQGVRDLRSLITWIEQVRKAPVVLAGVSLGAYTCCMTAVVDDRPKAVISILGGSSLAQILWDGYQLGLSKRQLQAGGVSGADLERYWALLGPGNWKPRLDPKRVLLIGGRYDPIVTPGNVEQLWNAWDKPTLHWYPNGHASIMLNHRKVRQDIVHFMNDRI